MRPISSFYRNPNWKPMSVQISNKSLKSSYRGSTGITRKALTELITKANTNGPTLDLSNRGVCDEDILVLVDVLPTCTNITHLFLSNNRISDMGIRRIFDILKQTSINSLDLSQNPITDIGAEYIINAVELNISIIKITLDRKHLSEAILKKLSACTEANTIIQHQINTELSRISVYKAAVEAISSIFPPELSLYVLDYVNESNLPNARTYLEANYYPKIISWHYSKNSGRDKTEKTSPPTQQLGSTQLKVVSSTRFLS